MDDFDRIIVRALKAVGVVLPILILAAGFGLGMAIGHVGGCR